MQENQYIAVLMRVATIGNFNNVDLLIYGSNSAGNKDLSSQAHFQDNPGRVS